MATINTSNSLLHSTAAYCLSAGTCGSHILMHTDYVCIPTLCTGSTANFNDLVVAGDLTVHGACTLLNTTVCTTSAMSICNQGTGPALTVTQCGAEAVALFVDQECGNALCIADNGVATFGARVDIHNSTASYGCRLSVGRGSTENIYFVVNDTNNCIVAQQDESGSDHAFYVDRRFTTSTCRDDFHISRCSSPQVTVDISGNVGIGTTAPSYKLHIPEDNTAIIGDVKIGTWESNSGYFGIGHASYDQSSEGNYALIQANSSNSGTTFLNSPNSVRFRIANTEKMCYNSTLFCSNIPVQVNSNIAVFCGSNATCRSGMINIVGPTIGNTIINSAAWGMTIGPSQTRSVTANTYYPGVAFNHLYNYNSTNSYGNAPQAWIGTRLHDTCGSERDFLVFATKSGTGTTNTGSDVPQERMAISPEGCVGIGTTDPLYTLHVQGDTFVNDQLAVKTTCLATSNNFHVSSGTTGSASKSSVAVVSVADNSTFSNGVAALHVINSGNRGTLGNGSGSDLLRLEFSDCIHTLFDKNGNVGIGTTNPGSYKLKVYGTCSYLGQYADVTCGQGAFRFHDGTTFRGGLGTDCWAHGASVSDIALYIQGDNDFFISTNGTKRFCLHSSGACFYNISGTASSPVLGLSNTASSTYIHSVEAFSPNMTSGQANISVIGKSATTKNSGYIGYYWSADASNSNFVSIGHWSSDHRFRVYGDGMTCATCNLSVGTCVSFCGSTIKTGTCGPGRQVCLVSCCTGSTGLEMYDSGGNFKWSMYGTGSDFGFLTSQWGPWGLRYNCTDGRLYLNNNTTYYLHTNSTSYLNHLTVAGNTCTGDVYICSSTNSWNGGLMMESQDGTDIYCIHPDNNGYMYVNKNWCFNDGDLKFGKSNPYLCAPSYIIMPGGLYVSGGTAYFSNATMHRGGVCRDNGTYLQISGGTSCHTYFPGQVGIGTTDPKTYAHIGKFSGGTAAAQEVLRLTGDYTSISSGPQIVFTNQHDSGTCPNTGEYNLAGIYAYDSDNSWGGGIRFQTSAGTGSGGSALLDRMTINHAGNVGIGTTDPGSCRLVAAGDIKACDGWFRTTGARGWYNDTYGGGWFMCEGSWVRVYNDKNIYTGGAVHLGGGFCVGGNSCLGNGNGDWVHVNDKLHVGATDSGDACFQFGEGATANLSWGVDWNWDSGYTFAWHARCSGSNRNLVWGYNVSTNDYVCTGRCINMCNNAIHYANELHFNDGSRFCGNGNAGDLVLCSNCSSYVELELATQGTKRGSLYANSSNEVGLLDAGASWAIRHINDTATEFYTDNGNCLRACIGTTQSLFCTNLDVCGTGTVFSVNGTNGTLFSVEDDLSDSLMSVNDAAGLPVLEVFADSSVCAGRYGCSDFYIACDGAVGIGTTDASTVNAPSNGGNGGVTKLHVVGAPRTTTFSASDGTTWHDVVVRNPTNSSANLSVGLAFELHNDYHENAGTGIAAIKSAAGDYGAHLAFITRPTSAVAQERMRITCDGNVGIGTTDPGSCKLFVSGDALATGWLRTCSSNGWYSETYGGGIHMIDSAYMRFYGSKSLHMGNANIHYVNEVHFNNNLRFCDTGNDYTLYLCSGNAAAVRLDFGTQTTRRGSIYADNANKVGILDQAQYWAIQHICNDSTRFYDTAETLRACIGQTQSSFCTGLAVCSDWAAGNHQEALTVRGTHASLALRNTLCNGSVWLLHHEGTTGQLQYYGAPIGCGANSTSWTKRMCLTQCGVLHVDSSVHAQVFYDSNNTNCYVDPSGRSVINALNACCTNNYFGTGTWDSVGATGLTNLNVNGHNQFWFGAGNGTWFTGTANTKSQASGLAADATKAHDLLITTMNSTSTHDRGITFAADNVGSKNSGWRLGKWHAGDARDASKLVVDGQFFAKGGYTDEYDYYADDYSTYYSTQGGTTQWVGDSGYGWNVPAIVSSSAIQIQSSNGATSSRKPQLQFHQFGYGGPAIEYDGPNDALCIIGPSSRLSSTGFKYQGNTIWHAGNDGSGSGLDADLLDGLNSTNFVRNSYNAGHVVCFGSGTNTGHGSCTYAIFQEGGSWQWPYPDLRIAYHTGIKIGANGYYQGIRFYDEYDMGSQVMSVNNNSDGLGCQYVYINNGVQIGSGTILYGSGASTFNEAGGAADFRVEACQTSTGPLGNKAYALFVDASAGAVGIGTSQPSYALEVNGTAFVTGTFSAGTKNFLIDHPTKENYMLRHGSLEGPENAVYVRGTTTSSSIELPEYWTGLVDEDTITATLTPRGKYLQLFLDRVEDNEIHVGGTEIGELYDYVIYGTRKDVEDLIVEFERPVGS